MRRRDALICLCLAAATIAIYWPVRHFEFTNYDDPLYVTDNPHVQHGITLPAIAWAFTSAHFSIWMPVTWLSCMLDCQLFGLKAGPPHLVNVLFHIANAVLLFVVLNRMTTAPWRSAFVVALFAWHPLHVESVAWVAERKDVLSTFFWMLTMWAYVRHVETPDTRRSTLDGFYALALLFFALGLMAKPMVVTLPFVLLLVDYWPLGRTRWAQPANRITPERSIGYLVREKLPFLALTVLVSAVTLWAEQRGGSVISMENLPIGMRVVNAVVSYVRYLGKTFWPVGLSVHYPYQTWPLAAGCGAAAILAGGTVAILWNARTQPQLVTGWFWYVGTLVPVIGLVQVGTFSMADRYTYIPLIGVFAAIGWSLPRRRSVVTGCALLLMLCAGLSAVQIRYWRNSETLFRHALNVTPDNPVAHEDLGKTLAEHGKLTEATAEFVAALRVRPNSATAHVNLANALAAQGKFSEAVAEYQAALRINPGSAEAHYNFGVALASQGKIQAALTEFATTRQLQPDHAQARYNLGALLANQGRIAEAIAEYREALRLKPGWALPLRGLAWIRATSPNPAFRNAKEAVQLAVRLGEVTRDQQADALDVLAAAYAEAGRFAEAVRTAKRAIELASMTGQSNLAARVRSRLKFYQAGLAYHAGTPAP
ncbi:MAG TPA: tetratricopeptide repeat protein [Verrucomicrobiae bacterium]|nr:tetratricopeptide repeat protein [Verrucomicrobiae bacterium]